MIYEAECDDDPNDKITIEDCGSGGLYFTLSVNGRHSNLTQDAEHIRRMRDALTEWLEGR